jgi:hypothetical protein
MIDDFRLDYCSVMPDHFARRRIADAHYRFSLHYHYAHWLMVYSFRTIAALISPRLIRLRMPFSRAYTDFATVPRARHRLEHAPRSSKRWRITPIPHLPKLHFTRHKVFIIRKILYWCHFISCHERPYWWRRHHC